MASTPDAAVEGNDVVQPPSALRPTEPQNKNTKHTPFADDPFRGAPLPRPSAEHIDDLNSRRFLKTSLIDFILRHVLPEDLPCDILIGSSNSFRYFETYNNKNTVQQSNPTSGDNYNTELIQSKYQVYSQRRYRYIAAICDSNHFFVISLVFDLEADENPIYEVRVYDSNHKIRRTRDQPARSSSHGRYLLAFQKFMSKFVAFSTKHSQLLLKDKTLILRDARYVDCPQQENGHDCGVFALATLLHLVDGHENMHDAFRQDDITKLRHDLHNSLSKGQNINWDTLRNAFPTLSLRTTKVSPHLHDNDKEVLPTRSLTSLDERENDLGGNPSSDDTDHDNNEHQSENEGNDDKGNNDKCTDDEHMAVMASRNHSLVQNNPAMEHEEELRPSLSELDEFLEMHHEPINEDDDTLAEMYDGGVPPLEQPSMEETRDNLFIPFFVDKKYKCVQDINPDMDDYETLSGFRFVIQKSTAFSRQYRCRSHTGCTFSAPFGRKRGTDFIILKGSLTHPVHCGPKVTVPPGGRTPKRRCKGRVEAIVDHVVSSKHKDPVANDVIKSGANFHGRDMTYAQAYRAVTDAGYEKWEQDKGSFEMIIPYLEKFDLLNEDSTVRYEVDIDSRIYRIFVCPGFMNKTMMHVRPVMSLDACHLRSKWKGTLYVASVKTTCENIYPVAFAITKDNENEAGWTWFLEQLRSSIKCLVQPHPLEAVRYKYFSFVSDRSKGLLTALRTVFPENYNWFCAIHIARNSEKWGGQRVTSDVYQLAKTFSLRYADYLLKQIEKVSKRAATYVKEIEAERWRSTAWLQDKGLPPRYGIITTNMSESTNNMFEKARDGSWLSSIDTILSMMMERICDLRKKMEGRQGFVAYLVRDLKKIWDDCAGYKVLHGNEQHQFTIVRLSKTSKEIPKKYALNIDQYTCECGQWQDMGYPCIDAMAYFRLHKKYSFSYVISEYVDALYRYETQYEMMKDNINPVCMETIAPDGCTLPPQGNEKRMSGRPRKKRFRKRPRTACDPDESPIVCSRCHEAGHNIRTCIAREREQDNETEGTRTNVSRLDLS
jgi:hypothetical protein